MTNSNNLEIARIEDPALTQVKPAEELVRQVYSDLLTKNGTMNTEASSGRNLSDHDGQSVLNNALGVDLYAQRRTYERPSNESDQEYLDRQQRNREAIQRGGMRGLNEGTRNAEEFLNQTGRIRVRDGNGVFGNPVDTNPRTRPAGIYPGPGRDLTIDRPTRW